MYYANTSDIINYNTIGCFVKKMILIYTSKV